MYSEYKLINQSDNIQPWRTPFPIWNQSVIPCLVQLLLLDLNTDSQEEGQVVWYSHLFQNFPHFAVIHTVKGFGVVNEAKVDVFLELSCFFRWSSRCWQSDLIPLPFLNPAWASGSFTVHILLKPNLENFEHYFASMWNECNCAVVWAFFGMAFLWDWNENWPFPVLWPLLSFPNLLAYWVQHFHSIIF